jgi:rod shape-determining protein MreC
MVRKGAAYPGIGDWVVLATAVSLSCVFLLAGSDFRFDAARFLRATLFYPFRLVTSYAAVPHEPDDELVQLRLRMAEAGLSDALSREAADENRRLRELLDFARQEQHALAPTQVVGRAADRFGEVLTLARGARDGVCVGQPVLGVEGLVGVVTGTDARECWVKTLRHGALPVSGMLPETRYVGVLRWSAVRGLLQLEGIRMQSAVAAGEHVVTSGHGRVFPKGVPVGEVVSVRDDSTALVKDILVKPFVDLDRAEELFLLVSAAEVEE